MTHQVTIDSDELEALRVLAMKALGPDRSRSRTSRAGVDISKEPLTWQETNAIEVLSMAQGAVVPYDRIVRHIHNRTKSVVDQWVREPSTIICRVRAKLRRKFGVECVDTVWHTKVNRRGHVVRDQSKGIAGYRWIGPDVAGLVTQEIAEAGIDVG